MNIVVLDGYTLNPGDLSWDALHELGHVTVFDRTAVEKIVERAQLADVILTNKTPLSAETLSQLPQLRYVGVLATGYNIVDVVAAGQRGIVVTNIPDYSTFSVAQHTMSLLMELTNRVGDHNLAVKAGEWEKSPDFSFTKSGLVELFGKKLGIIGHGQIGQQVGRVATALGMQVLCVRRPSSPDQSLYGENYVEENDLLQQSDVISLHCPLTHATEHMINRKSIELMKQSALLINTSRGGLIKEDDLAFALNNGRLSGAGLDVLSLEPPTADNPLLTASNCIITPHIAWATKEARARLLSICIHNIRAFMNNEPINVV